MRSRTTLRPLSPALLATLALACLSGAAALLGIGAAGARASSLVYTRAGNVWLANPDGSGQYQVTLDGTPNEPYSSPSQSQDGTIEAQRGAKLYRMSQNGTLLNAPFSTSSVGTPPLDPLVSPDGSKVSFWSVTGVDPCFPWRCFETAVSYQITYSDHWVPPTTFAPNSEGWSSFGNPTWMSNSRELLFTRDAVMWYYELGQAEPVQWFEWGVPVGLPVGGSGETGFWEEGATSADGSRLALLALSELTHRFEIQIFSASGDLASGNPPALPHAACALGAPDGSVGSNNGTYPGSGSLFDGLSWSPDDSSLAYEYNGAIYVAHITSLTHCEEDTVTQVIAGGSDPDWGPANVNPAPRPQPQAGGGGAPGGAGATQVSPHTPQLPCAGLAGLALRRCNAGQAYHRALAECVRRHHGSSRRERALAAACRRRAASAYHRALALAACAQKHSHGARARCERAARRVR